LEPAVVRLEIASLLAINVLGTCILSKYYSLIILLELFSLFEHLLIEPRWKRRTKKLPCGQKLDFGALLVRELRQLKRLSRFQISLPGGDTEGLLPRTQGSCCRGGLRPVVGAHAPIDL